MADVFRQPLVAPPQRKKAADQTFVRANLLLTTLAVAAAAPFFGRAMDNPIVRKKQSQPALTATGRSPANMIAPQLKPGTYEFFAQPPAKRTAQQPTPQPNLLLTTLAAQAPMPFRQTNWPNPVVRKHVLRVTHWRSSYDPPPPVTPPEPFPVGRQLDFPNPSLRKRTLIGMDFEHSHYVDRPDFLLTSVQHDWPNPVRRKHAQQPAPYLNLLSTTLYVAPAPPFRQTDWPNPIKAKVRVQADSGPVLPLTTLYVPPQPFPIGRQQDFPNPVTRKHAHGKHEISGTPLPNTIPDPIVPPTPEPSAYVGGGGGGGGGPWYKEERKRPTVYDKLRKDIKRVVIDERIIRDVYAELKASEEAAPEAAKATQSFAAPDGSVDWDAMSRDLEAVQALMAAAKAEQLRREIAEDDADWEWF